MKSVSFHHRSSSCSGYSIWAVVLLALVSLLVSGCETTSGPDMAAVEMPSTVSKGMTAAEVVAILGEPKELEEVEQGGVVAEIWRYEKEVVLSSTIESDGEQERVFADPQTGKFVTVREPIFRNESVKGLRVAELLFVEGKVVALKEREEVGDFDVNHGQR